MFEKRLSYPWMEVFRFQPREELERAPLRVHDEREERALRHVHRGNEQQRGVVGELTLQHEQLKHVHGLLAS